MMNPLLRDALVRDHQRAMQRVEGDARRVREAQLALPPQPSQAQPTKHPYPTRVPQPAIDVRH